MASPKESQHFLRPRDQSLNAGLNYSTSQGEERDIFSNKGIGSDSESDPGLKRKSKGGEDPEEKKARKKRHNLLSNRNKIGKEIKQIEEDIDAGKPHDKDKLLRKKKKLAELNDQIGPKQKLGRRPMKNESWSEEDKARRRRDNLLSNRNKIGKEIKQIEEDIDAGKPHDKDKLLRKKKKLAELNDQIGPKQKSGHKTGDQWGGSRLTFQQQMDEQLRGEPTNLFPDPTNPTPPGQPRFESQQDKGLPRGLLFRETTTTTTTTTRTIELFTTHRSDREEAERTMQKEGEPKEEWREWLMTDSEPEKP